jgi:hypothetical protein
VFHGSPALGQWGTVSYRSFTQSSADVACRSVGLRARPGACGLATSACGGVNYPPAVLGTGVIWLEGVDCNGQEITLHDCPAAMRERTDSITGVYGLTKWALPQADVTHEIDVGLCCWPNLPLPNFSPSDVVVTVALGLPLTVAQFTPGLQTLARQSLARAASVPETKVKISSIATAGARRHLRRVLAVGGIKVVFEVASPDRSAAQLVADRLNVANVNENLVSAGLSAATVSHCTCIYA